MKIEIYQLLPVRSFAQFSLFFKTAGFLSVIVVLLVVSARLGLPKIGHWLVQSEKIEPVDAIVVLGGNDQRTLYGITLYNQGLASEFWHTGNCVSPDAAAQLAIQHGIPTEAIHVPVTHNTWQDGQATAALVKEQGAQSILVVTDWFHSRRASSVIQYHLANREISISYAPLSTLPYGPDNWWQFKQGREVVFKELVKIAGYWWRYGVIPW